MKKLFPFVGTFITVFAMAGIIYTATSIIAYPCAPPDTGGMTVSATVCTQQDATLVEMGVSLIALAFGIMLSARSRGVQKKK